MLIDVVESGGGELDACGAVVASVRATAFEANGADETRHRSPLEPPRWRPSLLVIDEGCRLTSVAVVESVYAVLIDVVKSGRGELDACGAVVPSSS